MVITARNANTTDFPAQKRSARSKPPILAEQQTSLRLELSSLLQTTLELHQLLQLFYGKIQDAIGIGSLNYCNGDISNNIQIGKPAVHSCQYKLITQNGSYGELIFSRSKRFSEKELHLIEIYISCLILPIRNALTYQLAIQSALRDGLTGVGNRSALENNLERDIALAKRHNQPLTVLVIDIDNFKDVNDNFGHSAGDHILKAVAEEMRHCCRDADSSYRFGGEEFVILLNKTDADGSAVVAERLRRNIESMASSYEDQAIDVTVSIGVATLLKDDNLPSLFARADKALYQAKNNGRNQVVNMQQIAENTAG